MKKFVTVVLILYSAASPAQMRLPVYADSLFATYYHQRNTLFKALPQTKGEIIFMGNSITDGNEWGALFSDVRVKNNGISGDISAGVLNRIEDMVKRKPAKVFLMIGVNDLARGILPDSIERNILLIADYLRQESPATKLFVQSILPVNAAFGKFGGHTDKVEQIKRVNERLKIAASTHHYCFINLYSSFTDEKGSLDTRFTNDGLHLLGEGYLLWKHLVFPYVYDLQEKPSLIPLPQQLVWKKGYFPLYSCKTIVVNQPGIENESSQLKATLQSFGWNTQIKSKADGTEKHIELRLEENIFSAQNNEAYKLSVSENKILVAAATPHGIFNGIQTLRQLMRNGVMADACEIIDAPAFPWRGYLIDVGRNYMSPELLKQQIDVMAKYKFNVFHFHPTEDIAWRIASKQFPQLTAPETMLRNKGMYYTEAEIKELINYCKKRHITFVPEIDMPGHSAAFKRAMNTDMQTDSGLVYVKKILKEFCETYDVPYIHIGADEVKITNKNFIPEVTACIESFGKKVIGWQPGGNFTDNTIRQLWMDDNASVSANKNIRYIDSRHLYLNHMDPLESVVTLFNRKICDKEKGDVAAMGATLCMWHDRSVTTENDILRMNAVYPGMLTFAERSWRGGGQSGWVANIDDGDKQAFTDFEGRLLDNKQQYFEGKPFTYVRQTGIQWKLFGPYDNAGNVLQKFLPETKGWNEGSAEVYKEVTGATIILRHWWASLIKGAIEAPKENTTWYASATIWSDEAGEKDFWIGFNNLSRSPATDSPPEDAWDNKGSTVWVNGNLINPPQWKRAGQKGNPEIPLIDEGYEFREPAKIFLNKGWNKVLIKTPIAGFKGKDWHNPVKWMFTFVETE